MDVPEEKPKLDVKYDWYQTDSTVVVTILARNVQKQKTEIFFTNQTLSIHLHLPDDTEHDRVINLAHEIISECCSYVISAAKVEVKLKKSVGIRWEKLEGAEVSSEPPQIMQVPCSSVDPHTYPTSTGKNWSAIEKNINEQEAKEKPAGDEALNKLFQDIYGKGDDNIKRAMNKSYMESGGTVLSTNWGEISKDRTPVKPPDGMEFKKWD